MIAPVFICGTGRCGTSWLHSIMRRHSRIFSTKSEGLFAVTPGGLFDIQREMLGLTTLKRFREHMLGPWFRKSYRVGTPREYEGGLFLDFEQAEVEQHVSEFERRLKDGTDEALRGLIAGLFTLGLKKQGKARWVEKTPRNVIYLKELYALFSGAKFVHIIRDGRDVAVSIMENFWPIGENPKENVSFREQKRNVRNSARYWKYFLETGFAAAAELPRGTCLELKYEDLIADPEATLRMVCDFIEEPFEADLLAYPPIEDRQGRWREAFSEKDKRAFKEEANDMLVRLGYEQDAEW